MGAELRGRAHNQWTRVLLEFGAEIPHYPSAGVIKPARLPPPPTLTGTDPEQWALQLLRAYSAVTQPRAPAARLADLHALSSAQLTALTLASSVFRTRQTQPVPWCKFSAAAWAQHGPPRLRRHRPSLTWVYGSGRLVKADLWYQWQGATTGGVRLVFTKSHKRLIRQYDKMRRELLEAARTSDLTSQTVRAIVRKTLPPSWYRRTVAEAQIEAEMAQIEINTGLRRGADLW